MLQAITYKNIIKNITLQGCSQTGGGGFLCDEWGEKGEDTFLPTWITE